jgi:hypothetical protein
LRCRIELLKASGDSVWVEPAHAFFSGDRIRLHVESSITARLTILQRQNDGQAQLLFPDSNAGVREDQVEAGRDTVIPLRFDENPAEIRLLLLLRKETPGRNNASPAEQPNMLLASAERALRTKGLELDVDKSGPQPALFAARPAIAPGSEQAVAAEIVLIHKSRPEGRE